MFEVIETELGKFTNNSLLGLTAQEVYEKEKKRLEQIDICPEPTVEERLEVSEQENKLLKAQVEALSANQDFYEECIVEMAALVYA